MSEIVWEEPVGKPRGRLGGQSKHLPIIEAVKQRPWSWAIIAENTWASSVAQFKRQFGDGFEYRTSGVLNGKAEKIYVRYVGENS